MVKNKAHKIQGAASDLPCLPVHILESKYLPRPFQGLVHFDGQVFFDLLSQSMQFFLVSAKDHNIVHISNIMICAVPLLDDLPVQSSVVQLCVPLRRHESQRQADQQRAGLAHGLHEVQCRVLAHFFQQVGQRRHFRLTSQHFTIQSQKTVVFYDLAKLRVDHINVFCLEAVPDVRLQDVEFPALVASDPFLDRPLPVMRAAAGDASQGVLVYSVQYDRLNLPDNAMVHDLFVPVVRPDNLPHLAAVVFVDPLLPVLRWLIGFCNQDFLKRVHVLLEALWAGIGAALRAFRPDCFGHIPPQCFSFCRGQKTLPDILRFHHVLE